LTRLWSDVMFAYAARESKALVANLPDHMEGFSRRYIYPQRLEDFLNAPHGLELRRDAEWITFRLRYPGPAGVARSDRKTIGRGIRWVSDGGGLSFEAGSAIQAAFGRHVNQFKPGFHVVDSTGAALGGIPHPWSPVNLVRYLPDSLRAALYAGSPISFGQLPKPAQDYLRGHYLRSSNFILAPEGKGRPDYDMNVDVTRLIGPREVAGLTIDAQVEEHPLFIASSDPTSPHFHPLFGVAAFPPGDPAMVGTVPGRRYRLGTSRKMTLTVHFPNGYR
jgi:hypothetical protein